MILAAGRGQRMMPLTAATPKPMLEVDGLPLIAHQLKRLADAGFEQVVINHAYLGEQIARYIGDGAAFGVQVRFSAEPEGGLETAGGIINALPLLLDNCDDNDDFFLVLNADVWCEFPLSNLKKIDMGNNLAHLVMVENPAFKSMGDFDLVDNSVVLLGESLDPNSQGYTFSGISILSRRLFGNSIVDFLKLRPFLEKAIVEHKVVGELYAGYWSDIGTPERLLALNHYLQNQ